MKKLFKRSLLFILLALITIILIFHKRLIFCYNIAQKYFYLNNEINDFNDLDLNSMINSMTYKDVTYKSTNGTPLKLDIYEPSKKVYDKSPVILYVHGGSWVYGNKELPSALTPILDTFRDEGYTIISTSYELMRSSENFEKQISDIKDTIRWIHKNSNDYNWDDKEIGVLGISSGAHLALIASYSPNDAFKDDPELLNYSSKIKYLIDFAGPTDLSILDTSNLNFDLSKIFSSIPNKEYLIEKYNPINYVTKHSPDTLIIHSKSDILVPFESSEKLYDKFEKENADSKFIALNNTSHNLSEISSDDIISISKGLLLFVISNSPL